MFYVLFLWFAQCIQWSRAFSLWRLPLVSAWCSTDILGPQWKRHSRQAIETARKQLQDETRNGEMMEGSEFSSVTVWKTAAANAEFIAGGFKITRFKHMSQPGLPWPVFPVESTQSASSTGLLELLVPCAGHVGFFLWITRRKYQTSTDQLHRSQRSGPKNHVIWQPHLGLS
jgi:hypothetical protein